MMLIASMIGGYDAAVPLRIDQDLAFQAEREAEIQNRPKTKQLEYWVKSGKAVSSKLNITDAFAVSQGIKTIKLEVTPRLLNRLLLIQMIYLMISKTIGLKDFLLKM